MLLTSSSKISALISLADLAREAGYSEYHFLRLFKQETGFTPADFIRKRRLSEIARVIDDNSRSVSDIAFAYGFNSKENFTRAFKSEHHILPTEYKAAGNSLELYGDKPPPHIVAALEIVTLPEFFLTVYRSDEERPPNFWNKYNSRGYSKKLSGGAVVEDFGVCRYNTETNRQDYWCGVRSDEALGNTDGTAKLIIPGGIYAVFTTPAASHFNFVVTIHRTWEYINNVWLPDNGYPYTGGYEFECYVEESRTYRERIFIPLKS